MSFREEKPVPVFLMKEQWRGIKKTIDELTESHDLYWSDDVRVFYEAIKEVLVE